MAHKKDKVFGTDGIRGYANQHPMTAEFAIKAGMAASIYLGESKNKTNRVLIGKDTRLSGYMLETALTAGLTSMGKDVFLLGPIPTPAVSLLTKSLRADLGIMISASHNPYFDNGIKLFDSNGDKLSDEDEEKIEELLGQDLSKYLAKSNKIGRVERLKEAYGRYVEYVKTIFPDGITLNGLKIVVDCANGAAYKIAPMVFYELGAEVISIGVEPNGTNINDNCGSTHVEMLRLKVLENGADLGIAFDGDADRIMMVDEKGNIIDGDKILCALAKNMKDNKCLNKNTVVGTIMANMGMEKYLSSQGIKLIRAAVGDRYVLEEIKKNDLSLGGEQSGHIILFEHNNTGDGLLTAVKCLGILKESGKKASEAFNLFTPMPQILKNVRYSSQNPLESKLLVSFISDLQEKNKENARILVRKSGTEKLVRVMVEGENKEEITNIVDSIVHKINEVVA
jgi:phosphoglucosamine mutase